MLRIDGSQGEGGGQILRTAVALSLVTRTPCHIHSIRAGRRKPGLMRQHLTAVEAALAIGNARCTGASLGSQDLSFEPGHVLPGTYAFDVGSAGSVSLVLQTVLPALLTVSGESRLTLRGGTHNPAAPPFEFLDETFLPVLSRMGPKVTAELDRHGFYPAGGGEIRVHVTPAQGGLKPLDLLERGKVNRIRARATVSALPIHIGERELRIIANQLDLPDSCLELVQVKQPRGPGNTVAISLECEHITEVFSSVGQRGLPAEEVARRAVDQVRAYLMANVAVGPLLADQLLIPSALAESGRFSTCTLSRHTLTNLEVIRQFMAIDLATTPLGPDSCRLDLNRTPAPNRVC